MTAPYADDPAAYWYQRGYTYRQQEAWLTGPDSLTDQHGAFLDRQLGDAMTILEVGCGYGRLLERLASRRPWCAFIGLDFSATQLTQARAYLAPHLAAVCLVEADARAIPVADGAVDLAYTQGCLMHVPPAHVEAVRQELRRVARTVLHIEETVSSGADVFAHDNGASYVRAQWRRTAMDATYPWLVPGQHAMRFERFERTATASDTRPEAGAGAASPTPS